MLIHSEDCAHIFLVILRNERPPCCGVYCHLAISASERASAPGSSPESRENFRDARERGYAARMSNETFLSERAREILNRR